MEDRMEFPFGYRWLLFVSGRPISGGERVDLEFIRERDEVFRRYSVELLTLFLEFLQSQGDLYSVGGKGVYRFTTQAVETSAKMRCWGPIPVAEGGIFIDHLLTSQRSRASGILRASDLSHPLLSGSERLALAAPVRKVSDSSKDPILPPEITLEEPPKESKLVKRKASPASVSAASPKNPAPNPPVPPPVDLDGLASLLVESPPPPALPLATSSLFLPQVRAFSEAVHTLEVQLRGVLASLKVDLPSAD